MTRAKGKDYVAIAERYAGDVVSGRIPACQSAVKACRRQLDDLARLCLKAQKMPSAQNNFLTKRLSVWVNADVALFSMAAWDACADPGLTIEDFRDEPCRVGIDLAPRHDFSEPLALFRRGDHYYAFARHYRSKIQAEESDKSQFAAWAASGRIETNPGNVTEYGRIEEDLRELSSRHQVDEVCFDAFSAHHFATRMLEQGFPMVEIRARIESFSESTKKLEALMVERKIRHDGDPVLAWHGIRSGLRDLDRITSEFQNANLEFVGGRPSIGKTTFCLNVADHAAIELGKNVAIVSMEMNQIQLHMRGVCARRRRQLPH